MFWKSLKKAKLREVETSRAQRPLSVVRAVAEEAPGCRDFEGVLGAGHDGLAVLAGWCSPQEAAGFDHAREARRLEACGACSIFVAADGDLENLRHVRDSVGVPVVRHGAIVDEYQVYESRGLGVDSVVLNANLLDTAELQYFLEIGRDLGMESVLEVTDIEGLRSGLRTDGRILAISPLVGGGVESGWEEIMELCTDARRQAEGRLLVCFSCAESRHQVLSAAQAGFNAVMIKSSLDPPCCR